MAAFWPADAASQGKREERKTKKTFLGAKNSLLAVRRRRRRRLSVPARRSGSRVASSSSSANRGRRGAESLSERARPPFPFAHGRAGTRSCLVFAMSASSSSSSAATSSDTFSIANLLKSNDSPANGDASGRVAPEEAIRRLHSAPLLFRGLSAYQSLPPVALLRQQPALPPATGVGTASHPPIAPLAANPLILGRATSESESGE